MDFWRFFDLAMFLVTDQSKSRTVKASPCPLVLSQSKSMPSEMWICTLASLHLRYIPFLSIYPKGSHQCYMLGGAPGFCKFSCSNIDRTGPVFHAHKRRNHYRRIWARISQFEKVWCLRQREFLHAPATSNTDSVAHDLRKQLSHDNFTHI